LTTANCPLCNSEIPSDHPAFLLTELSAWVTKQGGWSIFESDNTRYGYPVGRAFDMGGRKATVVARKTSYDSGDIDAAGFYDGELPQGTTFSVYVVIKVGDSFFKKTGTGDSYGEISWDGDLLPVTPKQKVIDVFE